LFADQEGIRVSDGIFLPILDLRELMKRNIKRLYQTGRYVPMRVILNALVRTDQLLKSAQAELTVERKIEPNIPHNIPVETYISKLKQSKVRDEKAISKFQFDVALTKLAGFQMHKNRTVSKLSADRRERWVTRLRPR